MHFIRAIFVSLLMLGPQSTIGAEPAPSTKTPEQLRQELAERRARQQADAERIRAQFAPILQYDIQTIEFALRIKVFDTVNGCQVYSIDQPSEETKFLGSITDPTGRDSIFSEYTPYGSRYNADSIWNEYGKFGGKYSSTSPFNPYTSNPPVIACHDKVVGHLSVNSNLRGAINPNLLKLIFAD